MINLNPKYKPLFINDSRFFMITGGRGSAKSFSVSTMLLLLTYEKGHNILFTRYTMTSASTSIIPEMVEKITKLGREQDFTVNRTEIINNITGNTIYFRGLKTGSGNQTAALKSLNAISTWVLDEAEEMPDEQLFDKVALSVRANDAQNRIIMVMNPTTKAHWIYNRFFESRGLQGGENTIVDDTTYIHTTYMDNKHLPEQYVKDLEKMRETRPDEFQAQIMGGWRSVAEGVIFTNWSIGDFVDQDISGYGVDYGFSTDPTTVTRVAINKKQKRIYLKELLYKPGLVTSQIGEFMLRTDRKGIYVADSAEPRLNEELKRYVKIIPAVKGQGSVNFGIALMQDYELIVTPGSRNLIKELNNYVWKEGKEIPVDDYNHSIDGIRYFVSYHLANPNKGKYFIN